MATYYPFIAYPFPHSGVSRSNGKLSPTICSLYYIFARLSESLYGELAMQRKPAREARGRKSMEISQTVNFAKSTHNTTEILVSTFVYDMFARE